jgi:hypothetical protein
MSQPRISWSGLTLAARRLVPRRWRWILAAYGLAVWLLDLAYQIRAFRPSLMVDALSYAAAGRHLLAGEPLYALFQLSGPYELTEAAVGRGFVYPPTAALLLAPLAPFGTLGLSVVFGATWCLFGLLAFHLARQSGLRAKPAVLFTLVVTFSGPAINAASSGNANLLIANALLASWLWPDSAGALAVLGGAIKFFPAAGLVWTVRRRGSLIWPFALAVGLLVAATLVVGPASWLDFLSAFGNSRASPWYYIASPTQMLGPGIGTAVGFGMAAAAAVGAWRHRDDAVAFALLGWVMILPAPDWYSHYLLLPLAAIMPLAARSLAIRFGRSATESDNPPAGLPDRGTVAI